MPEKSKKIAKIKVSNINCALCALNAEKSLKALDGVYEANINMGTEKALVEYDPNKLKLAELENAVKEAGYGVVNEKVVLKVGGMSCVICVKAIENVLGKIEGINNVTVNIISERVNVSYNPQMVSIIDMKNAIEDVGYQYLGVEDIISTKQEEKLEEDDLKTRKKRMIVAFGFGIPLAICTFITWSLPISLSFFSLLISIIPFIYVSYPIFSAGIRSLKNKHLNMDVMYSMVLVLLMVQVF